MTSLLNRNIVIKLESWQWHLKRHFKLWSEVCMFLPFSLITLLLLKELIFLKWFVHLSFYSFLYALERNASKAVLTFVYYQISMKSNKVLVGYWISNRRDNKEKQEFFKFLYLSVYIWKYIFLVIFLWTLRKIFIERPFLCRMYRVIEVSQPWYPLSFFSTTFFWNLLFL